MPGLNCILRRASSVKFACCVVQFSPAGFFAVLWTEIGRE
jgi:hypothetical protein